MALLDWIFIALPLLMVLVVGLYSQRYVRSVADFMSANRSAGRYLLCIAGGELQAGAVVFVAAFEMFGKGGFSIGWWWMLNVPVGLILTITGFVSYRLRQTRAMTLAQFFEIRYSKAFRVFTGIIGFLAGIFNFGIIPAVGARVMVYFLGLPEQSHILGFELPTYVALMAIFLSIAAFVAISGGVITVMMVDTMEGILSQVFYLIIIACVLTLFSWSQMDYALNMRPPGHSLVNPFDAGQTSDFNFWYVLIAIWGSIYGRNAWQNASAYSSAGLTPHEGRMAGVLTHWREMGKNAVITFLAVAALTYLNNPDFAAGAAAVHERLKQISDPNIRNQMEATVALSYLLPVGVKGILCAVLLMGIFGGDATHLHSWGGIFIQDVLVPLRKKPFGPRAHLLALRLSICCVAFFAFIFGWSFQLVDYINMWWALTCAIFVGGAGACIIGGLYWQKGTTQGAFAGFIVGSVLAFSAIFFQKWYFGHYHHKFFLNGQVLGFLATLIAATVYVVVSLRTCREPFNLDRMLHRGAYAKVGEMVGDAPVSTKRRVAWGKIIGIDSDFTVGDKWITGSIFGWNMLWFAVFLFVTTWNLLGLAHVGSIKPWPNSWWSVYRHYTAIYLPIFFSIVTCIWFCYGGIRDMRRLFKRLSQEKVNHLDDGTVINNQNLDEAVVEEKSHHGH